MCGAVSGGVISVADSEKAVLHPDANLTDPGIIEAVKNAVSACPVQAIEVSEG